ncbi:hypothetical protein DDZ13_10275 [Coraliomargarita sinensis]|uniref:Glycosyl transferase family 1 n=1 Tax=Coraliomargarita sinensis TaxID=2174842 RepID=A0A317ZFN0_9BACT|nr:glycosyltransferase [Coraliomargarita sinensis]PXA03672.1 hypothetical protein DDZ13_10275 [Coraliomargarita sinensis]
MKILLSIGAWNPAHGGPFFSVGNLAKALAANDHIVSLLAADYPHMSAEAPPEGVPLELVYGRLVPGIRQTVIPRASRKVDQIIVDSMPQVIHDNGLWLTLNHKMAQAAQRHSIPRMLSPRGTLDPWAFQYRNWKKRIAMELYQRKDLERVDCFHAASALEAGNIRKFGLRQPIAIIPNGVEVPGQPAHFRVAENISGDKENALATSNLPKERIALFMGRMHPVKNLPALIQAWAKVQPSGWRLKLVGSSEVGHREELEKLAEQLGVAKTVMFSGPVYGEEKTRLFRDAQLFCLVSHSENFGIAAAEGLAAGLPLIASKTIPWEAVVKERAGWWVDGSAEGLAEALAEATKRPPDDLEAMGLRGRQFAMSKFGWKAIVEKFISVYGWMNGLCERPSCIEL